MLHLVPALILLILQGPSGSDGLPTHGRLPAALDALYARLVQTDSETLTETERDATLASLIALSAGDPRWSAAIASFLFGGDWEAAPATDTATAEDFSSDRSNVGFAEPSYCRPLPVDTSCCRFRDGPTTR